MHNSTSGQPAWASTEAKLTFGEKDSNLPGCEPAGAVVLKEGDILEEKVAGSGLLQGRSWVVL